MTMKEHKFCQSCGFPLKKDKRGGGTEEDRAGAGTDSGYAQANPGLEADHPTAEL